MQENPAYQAANIAAPIVEEHFERHLEEARKKGETALAPKPDARAVAGIINATFWASFRPEEGRFPKISLAYLPPEKAGQPLVFEHSLPLTASMLTKLAPAVERPEIHLGVWTFGEELRVWGATRTIPSFCFVLEDVEPGLLVVKHRRLDGFGKYANVVVLKGEQVKVIDEEGTSLPDCPDLLKALLAFTALGLIFVCILTQESEIVSTRSLKHPPQALLDKARGIVAGLGYTQRPADFASGFQYVDGNLENIRQTMVGLADGRRARWHQLLSAAPSPVSFWYRQSTGRLLRPPDLWSWAWVSPSDISPYSSDTVSVDVETARHTSVVGKPAASFKAFAKRQSPSSTDISLPQFAASVGRPRRIVASSITSS